MLESEISVTKLGPLRVLTSVRPVLMEIADNGILFMDEISSMTVDIQAKLLRSH